MADPQYIDKIPLGSLAPKPKSPPPEPVPLPDIENLEEMLRNGLRDVVQTILSQSKAPLKIDGVKIVPMLKGTELYLDQFITSNPRCIKLKQQVRKLALVPDEVLITGETGTGKELLAKAMIGDRSGSTVVANCAGLPENLIESELFGHVRGAFTGAESQKQGMFATARDGVMFLDEIGDLPLSVQGKLLRAIQYKKIRKVGSNVEEDVNCKFVCATHRDLREMVKNGLFREDLYARISTFELHIPPLRDRLDDCILIIQKLDGGPEFLRELNSAALATGRNLGAIDMLSNFDLSLNVRALQRAVRRFKVFGSIYYT